MKKTNFFCNLHLHSFQAESIFERSADADAEEEESTLSSELCSTFSLARN